jgi:hypothetical protein
VVGSVDKFPIRILEGVTYDESLLRKAKPVEDAIRVYVKGDGASSFYVLKPFVAPQSTHYKLRSASTQHYVGAVVGDQLAKEIQQRFQNSFQTEILRQRNIGVAQNFSLAPYGVLVGQPCREFRLNLHQSMLRAHAENGAVLINNFKVSFDYVRPNTARETA